MAHDDKSCVVGVREIQSRGRSRFASRLAQVIPEGQFRRSLKVFEFGLAHQSMPAKPQLGARAINEEGRPRRTELKAAEAENLLACFGPVAARKAPAPLGAPAEPVDTAPPQGDFIPVAVKLRFRPAIGGSLAGLVRNPPSEKTSDGPDRRQLAISKAALCGVFRRITGIFYPSSLRFRGFRTHRSAFAPPS